ncbi:MAG: D-aminoacylase [Gemmatimonadota bacterium]|nr:D-aminoacylase [Gemmatimonadota bacterium]
MRFRFSFASLILLLSTACAEGGYDIIIAGGTVVDGTGAERFVADIGIRGDMIVAVSREGLPKEAAASVVDASGLIVAPGFIDIHSHLDPLLRLPDAETKARQGVTTAVGGPDGGSPWPLGEYLDSLEQIGVGVNIAMLVGHNTIRREVMGMDDRAPTAEELQQMRDMVDQAMRSGAWGISTGLKYLPGAYSDIDEVVALAEVAAQYGGVYTSHLREEGLGLLDGVGEAIEIGRRAHLPIILTHHKVVGQPMWGSSIQTLAMVDSANAEGLSIRIDQYPYTATYTGIGVLIPAWAMAGGEEAFFERLEDPAIRDSIVAGIVFNIINDRGGNDLSRVQLAKVEWQPELEGGTLRDWADMRGLPPTPETGAELVIEAIRRGGASAIYHVLDEADVVRIMQHDATAIASDGRLVALGDGHPHPRWYGTFPRVLGKYVREDGVLSLEEAIRKMTTLAASHVGIEDRGRLERGYVADVVIFSRDEIIDNSSFEDPHQYPSGISYVFVNGQLVVEGDNFLPGRIGRVLRK